LAVPVTAVTLAVVVWLVRAARHLEAARTALAQQAVIGERLRIDGELRRTVGAALEAIAVQGERANTLADTDPKGPPGSWRRWSGRRARRWLPPASW